MPLYEYRCGGCGEVAERLVRSGTVILDAVGCERCGDVAPRIISRVNFKLHRKAKYSEEFLGRAMPAMKRMKETAPCFGEGAGSDEAKAFALGEKIGAEVDRALASQLPRP